MEGRKLAGTVLSVSCRTLVFVLIVMLLYLCGRTMFNFGKAVFAEEAVASADNAVEVEVIIPRDYTTSQDAQILKDNGLINDTNVFKAQVILAEYSKKFIPGTYKLNNAMKPSEIMSALSTRQDTKSED